MEYYYTMRSTILVPFIFALVLVITSVECNSEGDILHSWRVLITDPNNVLQSWDPTLVNPCTWFHVTCNMDNSVTRVDLGNGGLSGPLIPQLGSLTNLQYLQVQSNNFTGTIPMELGNLKRMISLGLSQNQLSGSIPSSLGNLRSLRFLDLDNNKLMGIIPDQVIQLIQRGNLLRMNVSNNQLAGTIRRGNNTEFKITTIVQDPKA
ncbi:hypothetical protein ACJIZ3_004634 [Penstemon smallii]|uniref:Leucine-rich repeat-containing N-terminal plant-type domain-containing protein n=1 Tax=Penstemon smallii TaxID=265156 RepID=A0ABD3S2L2_9LAMI